jgi:hypothetical protein
MDDEDGRHSPRPPAMFVHGTVKAPGTNRPRGTHLWSLRGFLALDELLKIDPFSLRLRQERQTHL